jgi:hypothetical protein
LHQNYGADPPALQGGSGSQELVPALFDRPPRHLARHDRFEVVRHVKVARDIELALRQALEPGAQIEVQQFGEGHANVRVAVGVDGQQSQTAAIAAQFGVVALHALDRRPGLPFVQDDRHVVRDAVPVENMRVHARRRRAPARIDPSAPEVP